jgi:hypothetical protein
MDASRRDFVQHSPGRLAESLKKYQILAFWSNFGLWKPVFGISELQFDKSGFGSIDIRFEV